MLDVFSYLGQPSSSLSLHRPLGPKLVHGGWTCTVNPCGAEGPTLRQERDKTVSRFWHIQTHSPNLRFDIIFAKCLKFIYHLLSLREKVFHVIDVCDINNFFPFSTPAMHADGRSAHEYRSHTEVIMIIIITVHGHIFPDNTLFYFFKLFTVNGCLRSASKSFATHMLRTKGALICRTQSSPPTPGSMLLSSREVLPLGNLRSSCASCSGSLQPERWNTCGTHWSTAPAEHLYCFKTNTLSIEIL